MMDLSRDRIFLIGGGPSLKGFDFTRLRGKGVIVGINHSIFDLPCDIGVSIDQRFILSTEFNDGLHVFSRHNKLLFLCPPKKLYDRVKKLLPSSLILEESSKFEWDESVVHRQGGTSGYATLDILASHGAKDIVLFGFDYGIANGCQHYHDGYSWNKNRSDHNWRQWAYNFIPISVELKKRSVRVLNASLQSAIPCFSKVTIEEALDACHV